MGCPPALLPGEEKGRTLQAVGIFAGGAFAYLPFSSTSLLWYPYNLTVTQEGIKNQKAGIK
ncbi:hypothetical protein EDM58_20045 [Brevibacillus panacihumi]|uniref:Uncharacterized protein n=1 Tax=Brevibacillus panacihumi TaxID=497735 RepID=A0A3M8CFE0_9BACL|nr:hypothetical protein EDM58_20045 [Brevibacillus panacihumi]